MHRKQLHDRVLERQSQLLATQDLIAESAPDSARADAVKLAIETIDGHLERKWDAIGAAEAAEISRWLESTALLCEPAASDRAEPILRRLETRFRLDMIGLPEPLQGSAE